MWNNLLVSLDTIELLEKLIFILKIRKTLENIWIKYCIVKLPQAEIHKILLYCMCISTCYYVKHTITKANLYSVIDLSCWPWLVHHLTPDYSTIHFSHFKTSYFWSTLNTTWKMCFVLEIRTNKEKAEWLMWYTKCSFYNYLIHSASLFFVLRSFMHNFSALHTPSKYIFVYSILFFGCSLFNCCCFFV